MGVHLSMKYADTCKTAILSCYKYLDSRSANQNTNNLPFTFYYFVGKQENNSKTIDLLGKTIVEVDCYDYYENLTDKVYKSIEWLYSHTDCEYVLKTDDDIVFNKEQILSAYQKIYQSGIDYAGNFVRVNSYQSTWHHNKCQNHELHQTSVTVPTTEYCSGGAYFLSKKSIKFILENYYDLKPTDLIYEDVATGYVLSHNSDIKKAHIENLNLAFVW